MSAMTSISGNPLLSQLPGVISFYRRPVALGVALMISWTPLLCHAGGKVAAWGDNRYGQCVLPSGLGSVKAISAGSTHSLALKADGTVVAWGRNTEGQTRVPSGLSGVVAISAGGQHSLALKSDGTVVAWGYRYYGVTNVPQGLPPITAIAAGNLHSLVLKADGTVSAWGGYPFDSSSSNTNVPAGLSNVVAVAAGSMHSLALKADGTVAAWGNDTYGQSRVPVGLSNVVAIAAGLYHSVALKADGTVVAWGDELDGVRTNVPFGLNGVVAIAAGSYQSLALKADGSLVAWGGSEYGATNLPPGISGVSAIACGGGFNLALVFQGPPEIAGQPADSGVAYQSNVVFSVAANGFEPLSFRWFFDGYPLSNTERMSGVDTASLTVSNAQFTDAGTYSVIVSNAFGLVQSTGAVLTVVSPPIVTQHPVGHTVVAGTNVSLYAQAVGTPPLSYQWLRDGQPVNSWWYYLNLQNVQSSQSGNYSLVVSNAYGSVESSNALVTVLDSPPYILTQPSNRSTTVGGSAMFSVVARGSTPLSYQWRHDGQNIPGATNSTLTLGPLRYDQAGYYTVAISNAFDVVVSAKAYLSVSQVTVWGSLPANGLINYPPGLTNVIALSAGNNYVLALKADGTVLAWGAVVPGWALPLGTNSTPTNVPPGLSNVVTISAGASHVLALKSDGSVVAWGSNSYGQTNVPSGLSNVVGIAAGELHSLALKSDGRIVAWGGIGSISPYPKRPGLPTDPSPWIPVTNAYSYLTNVPSGLSNVVAVAAGSGHSLALKNDGTVVTWGYNLTNTIPESLSNVVAIACGTQQSRSGFLLPITKAFDLALRIDGSVVSWTAGTTPSQQPQLTVMPGVSNAVAIAASTTRMALRADGRVVIWGSSSPVPGLSNAIAIATGYDPTSRSILDGSLPFYAAATGDGSPCFSLQPAGQSAAKGATVRFHARAVGVQPLSYQWQFSGADISGATNGTLTLTNVQGNQAGGYRVRAFNSLGATTSAVAQLTIPFSTNLAEALNATNLVWTTDATNAPWFAQNHEMHDGDAAAQSGAITHNQQSVLRMTVVGPGTLTFWWKVSSEQGYDFLKLYQNVQVPTFAPILPLSISGETGWEQRTVFVYSKTNQFGWVYSKDSSVSAGSDAGWVDEVVFTPTPVTVLHLAAPVLRSDGSIELSVCDNNGNNLQPADSARCEVQVSTNLVNWDVLPGALTLTNGVLCIRDHAASNSPIRFYRVAER